MCRVSDCDGIIINAEKICKACEEKNVSTTITDSDYYIYKDSLKVVLFDEHAKE